MIRRRALAVVAAVAAVLAPSCGDDDTSLTPSPTATTLVDVEIDVVGPTVTVAEPPAAGDGRVDLRLTRLVSDLENPVAIAVVPGSEIVFIVEQPGRVRRASVSLESLVLDEGVALDLTDRILSDGTEQGLLGVAVSPDGSHLVVAGTMRGGSQGTSTVLRYDLGADGDIDAASETVLLEQPQPYANHNGGHVTFGPDGMLYIGLGDGGDQGDPLGTGQDTTDLLGSILRIDSERSTPQRLAVPSDNPLVGDPDAATAVWAWGLRNPWRFSFDLDGRLWIGDVGGSFREEIDRIDAATVTERGANFGWSVREGRAAGGADGAATDAIEPLLDLDHDDGYCSVIGGVVSIDPRIPELAGTYVFSDLCRGQLHAITGDDLTVHDEVVVVTATTYAIGPSGETLVAGLNGEISRIDRA